MFSSLVNYNDFCHIGSTKMKTQIRNIWLKIQLGIMILDVRYSTQSYMLTISTIDLQVNWYLCVGRCLARGRSYLSFWISKILVEFMMFVFSVHLFCVCFPLTFQELFYSMITSYLYLCYFYLFSIILFWLWHHCLCLAVWCLLSCKSTLHNFPDPSICASFCLSEFCNYLNS